MSHSLRSTGLPTLLSSRWVSNSLARSALPKKSSADDGDGAVVAPFVGITDLVADGVELGQRLLLGGGAHPVELLDAHGHGVFDLLRHLNGRGLQLRRKSLANVLLPQRFAQLVVDVLDAALPARLQFLRATQILAIEIEILVNERRGKIGGAGIGDMEAQIDFPVVERDRASCAFRSLKNCGDSTFRISNSGIWLVEK